MASRGCGANRTAGGSDPDRQALLACRGQLLHFPCSTAGEDSVGPRLESATVERRKGSRSHREGPRLTSAGVAPRTRDISQRVRLSALHPPLGRGTMQEEARTGRKKKCFDAVRLTGPTDPGQRTHSPAPREMRLATAAAARRAWPGSPGAWSRGQGRAARQGPGSRPRSRRRPAAS